ncbi:MAG: tetraacyldisaccharide 4'-kinase [Candidatus Omnitrophica bacterium]|nr:tetraacyldisaccharide 4'-kinase [Candidatus Omnitrophota bacterium]
MKDTERVCRYFLSIWSSGPQGAREKAFFLILIFFSVLYGACVRLIVYCYRRRIFRKQHAPLRVIGVGNITVGGTGKTPLCALLSEYCSAGSRVPVIVMRGHGNPDSRGGISDESILLSQKLRAPVLVSKRRLPAIMRAYREYGSRCVILDDAFQQWGIRKDIEIVIIDSLAPFGNRRLLPAGPLREPIAHIARADMVLLSNARLCEVHALKELRQEVARYVGEEAIYEVSHVPVCFRNIQDATELPPSGLEGKNALLFCGIGNPVSFEKTVASLGIAVRRRRYFSDHYWYTQKDLDDIATECADKGVFCAVTTEKDAVRLQGLITRVLPSPLYVMKTALAFPPADGERFYERISRMLDA